MQVDIHVWKNDEMVRIGYIDMEIFSPERCFDICNWSARTKSKPSNLHANIEKISHGVCFTDPKTGVMWMPKSIGWLSGNIDSILDYIKENQNNKLWL